MLAHQLHGTLQRAQRRWGAVTQRCERYRPTPSSVWIRRASARRRL
jgi:hypothetical protein